MIANFFLVITLCAVEPGKLTEQCDDYIIDGGLNYSDCQKELIAYPFRDDLFSIRCDRGEELTIDDLIKLKRGE